MFYKTLNVPENKRNIVNTFLGYNHNHLIQSGEFYDMKNLSSAEYPLLTPREQRRCILELNHSDWQEVPVNCVKRLEGQISETKGIYVWDRVSASEKEEFTFSFVIETAYVKEQELILRFFKDDVEIFCERYKYRSGHTFSIPEGTNGFRIEVIVWPRDPATFTEIYLDECIYEVSLKIYNWNIRGMLLKDGKLAYMVGTKLYYDGNVYDFKQYIPESDDYKEKVQLVSFGTYILIFPLGMYLNTRKTADYGMLGAEYVAGSYENKITFTMSDANGEEIDASAEKPEAPENGAYWLDTSEEKPGLYKWSESLDMWVSVSSTYIRIDVEFTKVPSIPFPQMFQAGDAVYMNSGIEEIDNGSIIEKLGNTKDEQGNITGGYILVKGLLEKQIIKEATTEAPFYFKRKIPKMNYVCVSNNRLWGCYSGQIDDENIVNEIYASKLGDPKNWYCYEGAATDSYALSLGDDGEFTGAFTYQGYPMFFKENVVYKVYGMYPASYQLYTYNCRGVQKGSDRSIAVVNEYLMYKSVQDICVFDGNTPVSISKNLGNEKYFEAAAGSALGKYYISMKNKEGNAELFVYDLDKGIWHKEDNLRLEEFAYNNNGELYGRNKTSVYGFCEARNVFGQKEQKQEEIVEWMAVTGNLGTDYLEKKYIKAIHLRIYMEIHSALDILVQNEGENWEKVHTIHGEGKINVYRIPIIMRRNNSFRIKLEGRGPARIYSMIYELEQGSDR